MSVSPTRRAFMRLASGTLVLLSLPLSAVACKTGGGAAGLKDTTGAAGVPDPAAFLALSSALTGFEGLDAALAPLMLAELTAHHGDKVAALVQTYSGLNQAGDLEAQIGEKIMGDQTMAPVAVAVIGLWYVGTFTKTTVPEAMGVKAYKQNLAWRAITKGKSQGQPDDEIGVWSTALAD